MSRARTRYTPSPADRMYMGNLRTTLYVCLIVKHEKGNFPLRIEDTNQERLVEGAVEITYQTLEDTDLIHDEGPDKDGGCSPYVQSECQASSIYLGHTKKLVEKGKAYYCFYTPERLATLRTTTNGEEIMTHDKHCLHLIKEKVEANLTADIPYIIRQDNPATGTIASRDKIYGDTTMDNSELDDMILIKSDGYPTYNFVNVADDHLMDITYVVRGNEYLPSPPKYNRLYVAFGWDVPAYVHCPLITGESHHRLSKRSRRSSFEDLLEQGFISQAVVNCVALLGWLPENNQEISILEETVEELDYHRMSKSPAAFDMTKLKWMNGEYMKAMDFDIFYRMVGSYLKAAVSRDLDLKKIASVVKAKIEVFSDIADHVDFLEALPEHDTAIYAHKKMKTNSETSLKVLKDVLPLLEAQGDFINDAPCGVLSKYVEDTGVKTGSVIWSIRIAIFDRQITSAGATEIMEVLGREESPAGTRKGIQMFEAQESNKWHLTAHEKW